MKLVYHTNCYPSTQEAKAGRLNVKGQSGLENKVKPSLLHRDTVSEN